MKDALKSVVQLDADIDSIKSQRDELFAKMRPIDAALNRTSKRLETLIEMRDTKRIENERLDWTALLEENGSGGMVMYKECEKRLREFGLGQSGYISISA